MAIKKIILLYLLAFSKLCLSINDYVETAALSLDGRLALGYAMGAIHIYNIKDFELIKIIESFNGMVGNLSFSSDNKMLIGSSGKEVKIWDSVSGSLISSWQIQRSYSITNVSFSPSRKDVLVSASGMVKVYDLEGREQHSLPQAGSANAIFNQAGTKIAIAHFNENSVVVYDVKSRSEQWSIDAYWPSHLAFSPDDSQLAVASALQTKIYNLDVSSGICEFEYDHSESDIHSYSNWILKLKYNDSGDRILFYDNSGCLFNLNIKQKTDRHLQGLGSLKYSAFLNKGEIVAVTAHKIMTIDAVSMKVKKEKLVK